MLRISYPLFFTVIFLWTFVDGAEFPQCNDEPMQTFIAVSSNCSKAIYCNGAESIVLDCDKGSPYFSATERKCYNSTTVCGDRPFTLLNIDTTTPLSIPTVATSIAIIASILPDTANPTTTTSSVAASTTNEQSFPTTLLRPSQAATTVIESATPAMPIFTTTSIEIPATTELVPVFVQCPGVDDPSKPLFLPHPKSCSHYYLCYHGVATLMKCPNKLHFDAIEQTCNTPEGAKCQVDFLIPPEKCQLYTVNFYPHPTNCNYYYLCEYGFLMVMQCPFNMYWDYRRRVCAMRPMARCYNANSIL